MQIRYETMKLTMHPNVRIMQVRFYYIAKTKSDAGTSSWPSWISHFTGSFVGPQVPRWKCCVLPCIEFRIKKARGQKRKKKREKFYIYLDVTHTHPAGAGSTLKGKKKNKADTRRADGQKQRRGGEGNRRTSVRNQPTRRNGPDKNSAHT